MKFSVSNERKEINGLGPLTCSNSELIFSLLIIAELADSLGKGSACCEVSSYTDNTPQKNRENTCML